MKVNSTIYYLCRVNSYQGNYEHNIKSKINYTNTKMQKKTEMIKQKRKKRAIPTERTPFVDEIYCQLFWIEGCRVVSAADPLRSLISVF
jgi:hypothetical protein